MQGIYAIENKILGRFYVGSSTGIPTRWKLHLSQLRKNKHHSKELQKDWNDIGGSGFEFYVLEEVQDVEQIHIREIDWIKNKKANTEGYNSATPSFRSKNSVILELKEFCVGGFVVFLGMSLPTKRGRTETIQRITKWPTAGNAKFQLSSGKIIGENAIISLLKQEHNPCNY